LELRGLEPPRYWRDYAIPNLAPRTIEEYGQGEMRGVRARTRPGRSGSTQWEADDVDPQSMPVDGTRASDDRGPKVSRQN
jgi:hypothetical protein